jgi:hypothetical protein
VTRRPGIVLGHELRCRHRAATVASLERLLDGLAESVAATQGALVDTSNGFTSSMKSTVDVLEADVRRSFEATTLLTERLIQVAQGIIDSTRQRRR